MEMRIMNDVDKLLRDLDEPMTLTDSLREKALRQRAAITIRVMLGALTQAEQKGENSTASRLIDAWVADKGQKIPWAKAVQIVAIVTKQPDAERDRLLRLGDDDDGKCEMCGRSDAPRRPSAGRQP